MSSNEGLKLRPISPHQRDWLAGEIDYWQASGTVTPEQAAAILRNYASSLDQATTRQNLFLAAVLSLAAVLFGAALFLLVGFNWTLLPAAAKLAIIFGVLGLTYALAFHLRLKRRQVVLSNVVFLLGGLFYGAAIWLVAQVYHMSAHYPDAFFWWAAGLLPLALLLDTVLLHALLAAVLGVWVSTEVLGFGHLGSVLFGVRWPWLPNGVYCAPLLAAPGLWWSYRRGSFWGVAVYVPLLAWWTILQPIAWRWESDPAFFIGGVGALLLIAAESHPPGNQAAILFRVYGSLLFGGALLPLSHYTFNQAVMNWESPAASIATAIVIVSLACLTVAVAEFLRYRHLERGEAKLARQTDGIRRRQWFPLAMAALMGGMALGSATLNGQLSSGNWNEDSPDALLVTIVANGAMVGLSLWLMWIGLRDDRGQPFGAGVVYFLVWIVSRYIDLFGGEGGMLGAAAMFFTCGLALVGVTVFWRQRKQVQHGS